MKSFILNIYIAWVITIFLSGCGHKPAESHAAVSQGDEQPHEVKLSSAQQQAIDLQTGYITQRNLKTALKVNGKLVLPPQNQAQVSLLMGGIVRDIKVQEGTLVAKGQVLAVIENTEFIQLQQDYLQSQAALRYLKAEYERQKTLQQDNINATKTFEKAEADYQQEVLNSNSLQQKLKLYNIRVENLTSETISSTFHVLAPIAGHIHTISIYMGQYAEPNKPLFEIVDNRFLHIDLTIFEIDISKIHVGQKITFTDANDPQHLHDATIFSINKAFEEGQQAVIAHAKIENLNEALLSGMFVEARINIDENNTNTLPSDAVVSNGNEHYIFAEYEPDVFRQVQVRIGATDQGFTEVFPLDSIAPDSKIVISGAYYLLSELTKGEGEHHE